MHWWNRHKYKEIDKYETTVMDGDQEIEVEITLYRHDISGGYSSKSRVLGVVGTKTASLSLPLEEPARRRKKKRRVPKVC